MKRPPKGPSIRADAPDQFAGPRRRPKRKKFKPRSVTPPDTDPRPLMRRPRACGDYASMSKRTPCASGSAVPKLIVLVARRI
jgi:hypothetical protein